MISVILPTYNREKVLLRSINSILNQTYREIELIVIDDNSNDNTENLIKEIKDDRIIYIKQDRNYGASVARNKGIEIARGEYVAFQDSDDEWFPTKLEEQLEFLKTTNSDVVFCSYCRNTNGLKEIIKPPMFRMEEIHQKILWGNFIGTPTIFSKRQCFVNEQFDCNLSRFQDWEVMMRITNKYKVVFLDKILINVYVQTDSITNNYSKAVDSLKLIIKKNKDILDNKILAYYYYCLGMYSLYTKYPDLGALKISIDLERNIKRKLVYILCTYNMTFVVKFLKALRNEIFSWKTVVLKIKNENYK
ncbi:glycosyltransferase family 2 protein [Paenibacillus sp. NPDC056579]|uniref:glycosyltransferase family 2 protein n=1 Tax=Paenibacillus sp. NPDC056579 TaxID=3345871 RepID=UPI00367EB9B7